MRVMCRGIYEADEMAIKFLYEEYDKSKETINNVCCKCGRTKAEAKKEPGPCYSGYPGDPGTRHIWKYCLPHNQGE